MQCMLNSIEDKAIHIYLHFNSMKYKYLSIINVTHAKTYFQH